MTKELLTIRVNGESHTVAAEPHHTLLEVLREELQLTGTKHGCELGECGACTVLIDGVPVLSCLTLPAQLGDGAMVTTVEGLATGATLHPLQTAFAEEGAAQCGYCTPGMLMSAKALLDANPRPSRDEIAHAIAGNLCRCTGYTAIYEA
ncbi:MAG: (2Fe-2S)-binding protein, partial [Chloroflexota bacterium]|nr:(2Fe-2S)-binding protein [Chloroflexota bacterium]